MHLPARIRKIQEVEAYSTGGLEPKRKRLTDAHKALMLLRDEHTEHCCSTLDAQLVENKESQPSMWTCWRLGKLWPQLQRALMAEGRIGAARSLSFPSWRVRFLSSSAVCHTTFWRQVD